jgi:nickel-dependent lactate racemase
MPTKKIRLAYGKKGMQIELNNAYNLQIVEPEFVDALPDPVSALQEALRSPIGQKPIKEVVKPGDKVGIIFSDITRPTPNSTILPAILDEIKDLPPDDIILFNSLGTHRENTADELRQMIGDNLYDRYRIIQNNAFDRNTQIMFGKTSRGQNIYLNRELMDCDIKILTGFIEPHFFAGFSGGGKALMPGMAHVESIRTNHSIRNLENPLARWGYTKGNPLWEDVMEAAELAPPLFLLNVTLNRDKEITGVFAGDLREAHQKGCAFARETAMMGLEEPFDIVITSNSGYPLDLNVYQAVKGMSAAERIIREGGTIIMAAECWDGIPEGSDYETILASVSSVDELMDFIKKHERELKDTWQVYFQAMIQMKADVYLHSQLDTKTVEGTHFKPVEDLDGLITSLVGKYGPGARVCVLPEGPHTIPYLV